MPRRHTYQVSVAWTGNQGSGTSSYRDYGRDHQVAAEGRPPIEASSEPLFRGDPARWNPELELTAALSQCHMLWYLHLCAVSGVVVTSYADDAHGAMEETEDGGGQFTEVVLRPRVTVSSEEWAITPPTAERSERGLRLSKAHKPSWNEDPGHLHRGTKDSARSPAGRREWRASGNRAVGR